jgi:hypothetical protein
MKSFSKNSLINLINTTDSDIVVAITNVSRYFTIRLNTTEYNTGIGEDNTMNFIQHWELVEYETSDSGDYFIFRMMGYPPIPLNNFIDTLRFEGKQFRVSTEEIMEIINNLKAQGIEKYQTKNLKLISVLNDYLFKR